MYVLTSVKAAADAMLLPPGCDTNTFWLVMNSKWKFKVSNHGEPLEHCLPFLHKAGQKHPQYMGYRYWYPQFAEFDDVIRPQQQQRLHHSDR